MKNYKIITKLYMTVEQINIFKNLLELKKLLKMKYLKMKYLCFTFITTMVSTILSKLFNKLSTFIYIF
jgi:hypothetical protein